MFVATIASPPLTPALPSPNLKTLPYGNCRLTFPFRIMPATATHLDLLFFFLVRKKSYAIGMHQIYIYRCFLNVHPLFVSVAHLCFSPNSPLE